MGLYLQGGYPKKKYGHIKLEHGEIARMSDYDGLPATVDFFQGDPITKSYNSKISVGFLIPVDYLEENQEGNRRRLRVSLWPPRAFRLAPPLRNVLSHAFKFSPIRSFLD